MVELSFSLIILVKTNLPLRLLRHPLSYPSYALPFSTPMTWNRIYLIFFRHPPSPGTEVTPHMAFVIFCNRLPMRLVAGSGKALPPP